VPDSRRFGSETSRVESFSDAVLAIVMTVLVLELRVPEHEPGRLLAALGGMWASLIAFFLSFIRVSVLWVNHHAFFVRIKRVDHRLLWLNLGVLLNCTIIPLPTAMLAAALRGGHMSDLRAATVLYVLLADILLASWLPIIRHLRKHPELLRQETDIEFFDTQRVRALTGVVIDAVAALVAIFAPIAALVLWTLSLSRFVRPVGAATRA